MISDRSIDIRNATCRQLLDLLQKPHNACGLIVGEAGSGKTHAIFRALHSIDSPYLYIKYDQFLHQESLPIKIMNRIPEIETSQKKPPVNGEFDWLMGQSEINYQCRQKLKSTISAIGRDVALIIDDIQWASMADIATLPDYLPHPLPDNLKILLISRNDRSCKQVIDTVSAKLSEIDDNFTIFHINELEHRDAMKFLDECAHSRGLNVKPELKHSILYQTKNNPFYIRFALDIYGSKDNYSPSVIDRGSLLSFINDGLERDLRYILFVGAQLGFHFPARVIEEYFSFAPKTLSHGLEKLKTLGILIDVQAESILGFSHDRIYEACKTLFISKHLRNVNRKLYRIFDSNITDSLKSKYVNRALFLLRAGDTTEPFSKKCEIYHEGLQQAVETFMYDPSYEIATHLEAIALERSPSSLDSIPIALTILIAKAFHQQGDVERAARLLDKTAKQESCRYSRAELLLMQADIHFSDSDLPNARSYTEEMLSIYGHPKFKNTIALKGYIALQMIPLLSQLSSEQGMKKLESPCNEAHINQYNKCLIKSATYYYSVDPFQSGLSLMTILRNSFKHGSSEETGLALQLFASVIIGGFFRDYKKAFYLSEYAFFLNTLFDSRYYYYRSIFTYDCFLSYFDRNLGATIEAVDKSFSRCLSVGASDLASYAATLIAICRIDYNASLQDTKYRLLSYSERLSRHNLNSTSAWDKVLVQFIDDTEKGTNGPLMQGTHFDIRNLPDIEDKSLHYGAYHFRGISNMLRQDWSQAKSDFREAKKYRHSAIGTYLEYLTKFYLGICEARASNIMNFNKNQVSRVDRQLRFLSNPDIVANNTLASKRAVLSGYVQYLKGDLKSARALFVTAAEISENNGQILDRTLALDALNLMGSNKNTQTELQNCLRKWCGHTFRY